MLTVTILLSGSVLLLAVGLIITDMRNRELSHDKQLSASARTRLMHTLQGVEEKYNTVLQELSDVNHKLSLAEDGEVNPTLLKPTSDPSQTTLLNGGEVATAPDSHDVEPIDVEGIIAEDDSPVWRFIIANRDLMKLWVDRMGPGMEASQPHVRYSQFATWLLNTVGVPDYPRDGELLRAKVAKAITCITPVES